MNFDALEEFCEVMEEELQTDLVVTSEIAFTALKALNFGIDRCAVANNVELYSRALNVKYMLCDKWAEYEVSLAWFRANFGE